MNELLEKFRDPRSIMRSFVRVREMISHKNISILEWLYFRSSCPRSTEERYVSQKTLISIIEI